MLYTLHSFCLYKFLTISVSGVRIKRANAHRTSVTCSPLVIYGPRCISYFIRALLSRNQFSHLICSFYAKWLYYGLNLPIESIIRWGKQSKYSVCYHTKWLLYCCITRNVTFFQPKKKQARKNNKTKPIR